MRYKVFQLILYSFPLIERYYTTCLPQEEMFTAAICGFHRAMKPHDCKAAAKNKAVNLYI